MLTNKLNRSNKRRFFVLSFFLAILIDSCSAADSQPSTVTEAASQNTAASAGNGTGTTESQQANQANSEATFDLFELRVKGNTMLPREVLERTIYPFLGPKKTITAVENARNALEDVYRKQGYQTVVVDIPEQNIEKGIVYLQVVEGKVSRLRVKDSRYFSLGNIKAAVPELAEGKVPNFPVMQKQLAELGSQNPDRKITPVLRAGENPGTLEVDLKVKDELPLHGRVELNGRNTSSTSLTRLVTTMHYDNLWQKMHSASLMYMVSPELSNQVEIWSGSYSLPIPDTNAKLSFYTVSSSSDTPSLGAAGGNGIIGNGATYGMRLTKPIQGFENYSHSLTTGLDFKDFKQIATTTKPVSYLPFMLQYNSFLKNENSLASFNVGVNFALRGMINDAAQFSNINVHAQPNYSTLTTGFTFNHNLPWKMEFASRFSGQVSDSPLINYEQFSLGGMQSVRGYFESQALVDDGFRGSLELKSPNWIPKNADYVNKLQGLVFLDGGRGWIQKSIAGTPANFGLASTGVGMRFQMWKFLSGVVDVGFPLIDLTVVKAGDPKVHFNVATDF